MKIHHTKTIMKCINLRTEYQKDPLGIDVEVPRLSWQIEEDKRNVMQISYQIQYSKNLDFIDVSYDTDEILSSQSNQIEYSGPTLMPYQRLYWRVKVKTTVGESSFSEPVFFETGMMNEKWKGLFIEPAERFRTESPCPVLKKIFDLKEKPVAARLYITALGMYKAHINEKCIDQDILAPGWTSYNNHLQYQTYDVTDMLIKGENIIAVILGSGWYMGRLAWEDALNHYGDKGALLAQLIVTYKDGSKDIIKTDEKWKSSKSAVVFSEIYDGEKYDARKDTGSNSVNYDETENARLFDQSVGFKIIGQNTPGVRVIDEISPVQIITTPKGDTVLDFGQNMVGWVKVSANGNVGDEIHLLHGEIMLDNEFYNINMRSAKTEATYILSGGKTETFEPHFTFFGFRYVKLDKYPGEVKLENFKGIVISSNLEYGSHFECSNKKVDKLFQNIIWGQKGNFVDIPTDCPQRDERLGWTADTQVFTSTACYNSLAAPFYNKWLKDLAYDQFEDGGVPSVIPDILHDGKASSTWGDAATIVPDVLHNIYKDKRMLKRQYPSMKSWVEYIRNRSRNETIWETDFHFGDWLAKDGYGLTEIHGATPIPLVATAFYYYSCKLLVKTAKILGIENDIKEYEVLCDKVKKAFNMEFVTSTGRISGETQTAYTLALHFGLLDKSIEAIAAKYLVELVRREEHRITTGFAGTSYIAHVLTKHGYNEDAYKMLLNEECPGWLYPVNMGATTIWERWDSLLPNGKINSGTMNSFNHYAYGSVGEWMFASILGITPENGYQIFNIAPKPSKLLNYAKGGFNTLYGYIESSWEWEGDSIKLEFTIPCNTKANIYLPFSSGSDIELTGEFEKTSNGIKVILGSGKYVFKYNIDEETN